MLRPYVANENNPHMHPAGEKWRGEKLYDFRFYELEIVSYSLPLAVFRWDTYVRSDDYHRHCDFYELVLVYKGSARNDSGTGTLETVTVGNVFLLPPGSIHRYQAIHEFAHFNILFRPELLNQIRFDLETLPGFQALFRNFGAAGNPTAISPFLFLPEAEISCVWKPRQEISRTASSGTLRVKEPSRSVMVPTVVPFTITPTPARPSPLESYTVPLISLSWAKAAAADIKTAKHRNRTFFISGYWFISVCC